MPDETPATGLRYNKGKLRYDLLPPDAIEELTKVMTMGAEKYAARNWENGFNWMEACYASLQRHATAFAAGQDHDDESGLLHMAHVMWNAMALVAFQLRGVGTDDRPKVKPPVVLNGDGTLVLQPNMAVAP